MSRPTINDRLIRARRGRRRLAIAGWVLVVAGPLLALTALVLTPFLFPFALAGGGTTLIGGMELARLRAPLAGVAGAAVTLLAGLASLIGTLGGSPMAWLSATLGALLVVLAATALVIVFADAAYLPHGPAHFPD